MMNKNVLLLALGGLAVAAIASIAVLAAGLMVRRQTNKLRSNMRSVSQGIYKFGTALQLLSGADAEDDCENLGCC